MTSLEKKYDVFLACNLLKVPILHLIWHTTTGRKVKEMNNILQDGICEAVETLSFRHYLWEI